MRGAMRQRLGLATTRAGDHQQRVAVEAPVDMQAMSYGLALGVVEIVEISRIGHAPRLAQAVGQIMTHRRPGACRRPPGPGGIRQRPVETLNYGSTPARVVRREANHEENDVRID